MLWVRHIDGTPFRKLGDQQDISGKQAFFKVDNEINLLPWCWQVTKQLCNPQLFSGILIIDGKYIKVFGFKIKLPLIWATDYLTHDIPHGDLFPAEDYISFLEFFQKLKELNYPLQIVVADDRKGLKQALLKVFPLARLQLCHVHYLENIRKALNLRSDDKYLHFFNSLSLHVFQNGTDNYSITEGLKHVWKQHTNGNKFLQNILLEIDRRRADLFNYLHIKNCPNNTNLIELYNSHFNSRLESIKSFQSLVSAQRWCNAYLIRRRTKSFTDCEFPFKHLNGFASLQFTIQDFKLWPTWIAGVKPARKEPKR